MRTALAALVCALGCGGSAPEPAPAPVPVTPPPADAAPAIPAHTIDVATVRAAGPLYKLARIVPRMENGAVIGYALYASRDQRDALERLGLRAGDVILSANGLRFAGGAEKALWVGVVLRDSSRFDLEVLRGGAKVAVRIELTGGTLRDATEARADEPLADAAALKTVVDEAFDDLMLTQVAANSYAFSSHIRNRIYDRLRPFERMRPLLGQNLRDGLLLDVPPGSWLARLGFLPGDAIVAINGRALTVLDDLVDAVLELQPAGKRIEIHVRRKKRPTTIVFEDRGP